MALSTGASAKYPQNIIENHCEVWWIQHVLHMYVSTRFNKLNIIAMYSNMPFISCSPIEWFWKKAEVCKKVVFKLIRGILKGGSRIGYADCTTYDLGWYWPMSHTSHNFRYLERCIEVFRSTLRSFAMTDLRDYAEQDCEVGQKSCAQLRCLRVWSLQFFTFVGATVRHSNKILCCFQNQHFQAWQG